MQFLLLAVLAVVVGLMMDAEHAAVRGVRCVVFLVAGASAVIGMLDVAIWIRGSAWL
ncbi:MAG: hypothetical protein AAFR96_13385 [Planctomycetota bacterium]